MSRTHISVMVVALGAILSGCGGSKVTLNDPTIPDPLIDKLPIKVAGRYPESFEHFTHEELVIGKEKWTIDLGASNRILFDQLFGAMFSEYQAIDADTNPQELGLDAFIEPTIDAFEFSVPNQSQTEEFAVWIRYRIKIYDGDGNQIANWPISAYGKSQTTTFGGDEALRRAAVLAMRDAAALVIMQMDKATGISKLSAAIRESSAATPDGMPDNMTENMPANMTGVMPDVMPDAMPDVMPDAMPDEMPDDLPDDMPDDMPQMPESDVLQTTAAEETGDDPG